MDPRALIDPPNQDGRVIHGNRWNIFRVLYEMKWTSCLIGLVTGCVVTVYMTLSLMLIIIPYIQVQVKGSTSLKGNDIWSSYDDWQWDPCSVTCGHGIQEGRRSRKCLSETYCTGNETEIMTRHCTSAHCQVDGQWSDWITDGPCSVTCGKGVQRKYRECSNPYPENGGKKCEGERIRKTECAQPVCCPKNAGDNILQCEGGWLRSDTFASCYCFSNKKASWYDAQKLCKQKSAILTTIYSSTESDWLTENGKKRIGTNMWIGGKREYYTYKWMLESGTGIMNFTRWAPGEPLPYANNDFICVQMWRDHDFKWDDYKCDIKLHFICKSEL